MNNRTHLLLSHLTLALAGVCLTCAELDYLPELLAGLPLYLALIALAWRLGGRWALPLWATNLLGLVIAGGAALWVWAGLGDEGSWAEGISFSGVIVPYLGPVLMALLLVRLFRSTPGDFWAVQGLGLLQVALGCVLASGTLFGLLLLAYVVAGLCTLAAHERIAQAWRSLAQPAGQPRGHESWSAFALRWALAVAVLAWPLFLLTPRLDIPDWEPMALFSNRGADTIARSGFSEQIDLRREGQLAVDETVAFRVVATDAGGRPYPHLPADQRWRGLVLDRYSDGVWSCALSWPGGAPVYRPPPRPQPTPESHQVQLAFEVPKRAGGLFLADPVRLGPVPGELPVRLPGANAATVIRSRGRRGLLFYEAGGTAVPLLSLARPEHRYVQLLDADADRGRCQAYRLVDSYLNRLLRNPVPELTEWTIELLRRLALRQPALPELREALSGPRPPGWSLPPGLWEPAARRLSDHLARSGEFSYSLIQRREAHHLDPVLDFVRNVKEGHCERYAAALTLMLRSLGVPARIVKGYRGAEHRGGGTYEVRQKHAHAWVEAVVPAGQGEALDWITLDPTPSAGPDDASWTQWLQQQQGKAGEVWRDLVLGYGSRQQADLLAELTPERLVLGAALAVGLLGGAVLLFRLWRRSGRARRAGRGGLAERLRELLASLAIQPGPEQTPRELAEEAERRLRARPEAAALAGVPARVVDLLYRDRWGGQPPAESELAEASRQIEALRQVLASSTPLASGGTP